MTPVDWVRRVYLVQEPEPDPIEVEGVLEGAGDGPGEFRGGLGFAELYDFAEEEVESVGELPEVEVLVADERHAREVDDVGTDFGVDERADEGVGAELVQVVEDVWVSRSY